MKIFTRWKRNKEGGREQRKEKAFVCAGVCAPTTAAYPILQISNRQMVRYNPVGVLLSNFRLDNLVGYIVCNEMKFW